MSLLAVEQLMEQLMIRQEIERLLKNGESVGETDVTLFGIDYSHDSFPGEPLEASVQSVLSNANVLVVHDTPYPVRNENGYHIHQKRGADFRKAIEQTSVEIDLIVSDTCTSVNRARLMSSKRPSLLPEHQHQSIVGKKTTTRQRGSSV